MSREVRQKIIIKNVSVLRANGEVQSADIMIEDDKIAFVGRVINGNVLADRVKHIKIIDGKGKFAIPGFVNAHTHASMTLLRSYSDDKSLMDWLEKDIWPIEAQMKRKDIYYGAALAAVEMIKSGTTAFADMYGPWMEEVAKVVDESGLRGILSRGLIGVSDGDNKLAENVDLYKNCNGAAEGRIKVMFGPHAIYTCPPDYLKKVAKEASKLGAEIHIHMNETETEIKDCRKKYNNPPFVVVNETGLFDCGTLAAHCVYLCENEIDVIKDKNIRIAHNPGSNMKLASGMAPLMRLLNDGITVGLGTDGASSNNNLDILEEARLSALFYKVIKPSPTVIPALTALKMATEYGANAVGLK